MKINPMMGWTMIILLSILFLAPSVSANIFLKNGSDITGTDAFADALKEKNTTTSASDYQIQFFFNTHCGACQNVVGYLSEFRSSHPDIQIQYFDLFDSTENRKEFEEQKAVYHRNQVSVPIIFIGNFGLEGQNTILDNFEWISVWYQQHGSHQTNSTGYTIG